MDSLNGWVCADCRRLYLGDIECLASNHRAAKCIICQDQIGAQLVIDIIGSLAAKIKTLLREDRMNAAKHPVQPLITDKHGTIRFKRNAIVRYLLDNGPFDLHQLALRGFSDEDQAQFAQLIGYSLGGYGDLPYVTNEDYEQAAAQLETD